MASLMTPSPSPPPMSSRVGLAPVVPQHSAMPGPVDPRNPSRHRLSQASGIGGGHAGVLERVLAQSPGTVVFSSLFSVHFSLSGVIGLIRATPRVDGKPFQP